MSSATESPQSRTGGETKVPRRIQLVTISRSPQTTPGQGVTFGSRNEQTMASPVATEISVVSAAEIPMEIQSAVTADSTSPVKKPRRAVLITLD